MLKPRWGRISVTVLILIGIIVVFTIPNPKILATVDGEPIYEKEFTLRYKYIPVQTTERNFLQQLILEKAVLQEIPVTIEVSRQEINEAIEKIKQEKQLSEKEFRKSLNEDGLTINDLKSLYYTEILIEKTDRAIENHLQSTIFSNISKQAQPAALEQYKKDLLVKTKVTIVNSKYG